MVLSINELQSNWAEAKAICDKFLSGGDVEVNPQSIPALRNMSRMCEARLLEATAIKVNPQNPLLRGRFSLSRCPLASGYLCGAAFPPRCICRPVDGVGTFALLYSPC